MDPLVLAKLAITMANEGRKERRSTEHQATVLRVDSTGTYWVKIPGGADETPIRTRTVDAIPGDVVSVTISGGAATMGGNVTSPTATTRTVTQVSGVATNALDQAIEASIAAESAIGSAQVAKEAADIAQANAAIAAQAAEDANGSATRANSYASDALRQLSDVEGVLDTVTWIAEHGEYVPTEDQTVIENKTYYQLVSGQYVMVESPTDANLSSYYELVASESLTNYVASHLALTDAGLWLLGDPGYTYEPTQDVAIDASKTYYVRSGSGTEQDPYVYTAVQSPDVADIATYYEYLPTDPGYRTLIAGDGFSVIDPNGRYVSTFGESVTFDSEREQRIGGESAYIAWQDTDNDGIADSLAIVADDILFRGTGEGGNTSALKKADLKELEDASATHTSELAALGGYIHIDPDNATIELGAGASVASIDNDSLDFQYEGNVVASIGQHEGQGSLLIDHAQVRDGGWLGIGNWQWVPRANGNVALKWVGE